jgi:hypothetical protein
MLDQHLRTMLLRQPGNNRALANTLCEKLSDPEKQRLIAILRSMEQSTDTEKRKRKQGQFWG